MSKEPKDYTISAIVVILLFIYVLTPMFMSIKVNSNNNTQQDEMTFESLTFTSVSFDTELSATDIDTIFDEAGNELLSVTFKTDLNNEIKCEIPASYKDQVDKDFKYKGHMYIVYANQYYDKLAKIAEDTYGTKVEDTIEFIKMNPDGFRITNIEFMFSDYIIDGVFKTNQNSENDLIKEFLADSQVGSVDEIE